MILKIRGIGSTFVTTGVVMLSRSTALIFYDLSYFQKFLYVESKFKYFLISFVIGVVTKEC